MSLLPERTKLVEASARPSFASQDQADLAGQLQPRGPWAGALTFCFAVLGMDRKVL